MKPNEIIYHKAQKIKSQLDWWERFCLSNTSIAVLAILEYLNEQHEKDKL